MNTILAQNISPKDGIIIQVVDSSLVVDPETQKLIDAEWQALEERSRQNQGSLFNGLRYRLEDVLESEENTIFLLSETDFKQTKCLENLRKRGETEIISGGFAIGGFIKTSDNTYVFGELSTKTVSDSSINFIGGVVDLGMELSAKGLWNKFTDEIQEEIGVSSKNVKKGKYLGLIETVSGNRILICSCELTISSNKVKEIFDTQNDGEMSDVIIVEPAQLKEFMEKQAGYKPTAYQLFANNLRAI
jgi:hypothetical protein